MQYTIYVRTKISADENILEDIKLALQNVDITYFCDGENFFVGADHIVKFENIIRDRQDITYKIY